MIVRSSGFLKTPYFSGCAHKICFPGSVKVVLTLQANFTGLSMSQDNLKSQNLVAGCPQSLKNLKYQKKL